MLLRKGDHVLFFGDSITDAGRRDEADNNNGFGRGFVSIVADRAAKELAELNLKITNRGIGGNRVEDLEARMEEDALALKPTVVSILVGINDTWRAFSSDDPSPVPQFSQCYHRILKRISDELNPRLVICEPFLLPIPEDRRQWRKDLDPRIHVVRDLARQFHACYVPLDGAFAAAACRHGLEELAPDGVHPTELGTALIADCWLKAVTAC